MNSDDDDFDIEEIDESLNEEGEYERRTAEFEAKGELYEKEMESLQAETKDLSVQEIEKMMSSEERRLNRLGLDTSLRYELLGQILAQRDPKGRSKHSNRHQG